MPTLQEQVKTIVRLTALILFLQVAVQAETIIVPAGGSVQSALNSANCGDTIIVQAGAAYTTNLILSKVCTAPITVQSSRASELPVGVRVTPAQAPLLAKIQSAVNGEPVIKTVAGAKGYRFIGIEITTASASVAVFDLVKWGEDRRTQTTLEQVPSSLSFDRGWIHGWATQNVQRGVAMNCAECDVINSSITDVHWIGADSQAIGGWNGTLNAKIINNYLEGAGENFMFGGADSAADFMVPTNIEIRRNHLFKPLSWKVGDPSYAGIHWTVKNLGELKSARNAVIDGNLFENCWGDAQIGYAILFTVRNQDGNAPWSTLENVSFTNNIVKNSEQGIQLLGKDSPNLSQQASGLLIRNNLFQGIANRWLTMTAYNNVTVDHNTHFQSGNIMTLAGAASTGFSYTNNVTIRATTSFSFGIKGDGREEGMATITNFLPGSTIIGNVIAMPATLVRLYPTGNHYPVDLLGLAGLKGTDGLVPGYRETVAEPTPTATPSPSPSPTITPTPVPSPSPTPLPSPSPSPVATPSPTPLRPTFETVFPAANNDTDRQRVIRDMALQGWNCQPNPGGKFLICHRVKM